MVGMQIVFGTCDQQTPHGGQPFHYWKRGYGFGKSRGPGQGNVLHPAAPVQLRFGPMGDRAFASNAFWKTRSEIGPSQSFGIGDRPDLYTAEKTVAPNNYGDVSTSLSKSKRNATRSGITLKPRFPSVEERARDLSWPQSGPGPAKYNTSANPDRGSSYSFGLRPDFSPDFKEQIGKPGAGDYEVRRKPGMSSPIEHGTLYNISMHGKVKRINMGNASPGPAKYTIKGRMDEYGLAEKISNVPGPRPNYWRKSVGSPDAATASGGSGKPETSKGANPMGATAAAGDGAGHGLTRVESSPM